MLVIRNLYSPKDRTNKILEKLIQLPEGKSLFLAMDRMVKKHYEINKRFFFWDEGLLSSRLLSTRNT